MPERLKAILDKITAWWKKFNTKQRSVLISIVAVVIVALVILGVVISRPTQVELVEAQSASEASTIKGVLEDNNISYEVDSKLVFFVNKSDEVNAIMALGDNGIPAQAYSIDNVTDGSFSTTEADKQKKYQVYLEDKLKDHLEKQSYISNGPLGIDFISAGSSVVGLNNLNHKQIHFIVSAINELNSMYDFIIIDTGAGVSEQVMEFVAASNEIVLVTTPEPTSITDSYSLLKALYKRPDFDPSKVCIRVISNRAASKEDGSIVFNKINSVVMQFLNGSLEYLGYVPSDAMVEKAVRQQKILSIYDPTSKAARSFEEIAKRLLDNESAALDEKRTISHVFSNFFNRKQ